ncbi:hypothetical protein CDV36_004146 [Fusarium kuroshium]|uniref:Uncharacterized protein n=2 Tax=Fusarium solani species complex TaxID=232080 RepID=A0A3M2SFB0_9HYPO|nr:hypothetical protein CDV36_004146 [Fusarium kuroshium]RSL79954.1 hypothetical protein CEP51_006944 [Fusarium floridanum]
MAPVHDRAKDASNEGVISPAYHLQLIKIPIMSLTRDTFIYRGALIIGLLPSFFGLNSLLRPEASLKSVEFPVPTDPESRKLVFGLMRIYGIRNVVVSFALTLIWLTGNKRFVGLGLLGALSMVITDGLVSKSVTGGGEWNHWSFGPVIGGFVAGLFGWF